MPQPEVGFLGLGAMGGGMAKHLLKHGFSVTGYDIFKPSVQKLVEAGGKGASSPTAVAEASDVTVVMVASPHQVSSVLFDKDAGGAKSLRQNAVIVICSTVPPDFCAEVSARLNDDFRRPDVLLLDCPVSGGASGAAAGTLSVFSSGREEGLSRARPVLECLSAKLYEIPGGVGAGSRAKMCHQVLPEVEIALACEAMALAARAGLNTREVFDAVQASDGWSWINGNRIPHMLEGDKTVYSAIPNSQKDSSIIVNASRTVSFPVFLVAAAEQVYQAGIHAGWAKDDDSTLWRLYLPGYPEDTVHQMTSSECRLVPRQDAVSVQDIADIFAGGHLATSVEAMGFSEAVGIDTDVMYDIISKSAGSNTMFVDCVPKMKKPTWSLRDVPQAHDIRARLESALRKANSIGASLPVASASLQLIKLHLQ